MILKPTDQESFPKLKKTSRSFKEIAEVAIGQIQFLFHRGYLATNLSDPGVGDARFLKQQLMERDAQVKNLHKELDFVVKQAEYAR